MPFPVKNSEYLQYTFKGLCQTRRHTTMQERKTRKWPTHVAIVYVYNHTIQFVCVCVCVFVSKT